MDNRAEQILSGKPAVRLPEALGGGQTAAEQFPQCLPHFGIPVVSQFRGEPDHRGFADLCQFPQTAGGQERRPVTVFENVPPYPLPPLGQPVQILFNVMQDVPVRHMSFPLFPGHRYRPAVLPRLTDKRLVR